MCYPLPGPRCSPHARTKLENTMKRRAKKHDQLVDIAKERASVRREIKANPNSARLRKRHDSLSRRGAVLSNQIKDLDKKVRLEQIDYDGTEQGQADLQETLESMRKSGATAKECLVISRRISRGRVKNFHRKAQLELIKTKKVTGQTIRQRRGDFIGFSDRDGTADEITHDYDLLTAA